MKTNRKVKKTYTHIVVCLQRVVTEKNALIPLELFYILSHNNRKINNVAHITLTWKENYKWFKNLDLGACCGGAVG